MKLRPEQLVLLGVLGVGLLVLLLQIGQDWTLPALGPETPPGPAAAVLPSEDGPRPPAVAGASAALGLRIDPVAPRLEDPLTVIAGIGGAEQVSEVSFTLLYDPTALSLSAGAHSPMSALANEAGEAPEMSVSAAQPGRLEIRLRRRGGDPSLNAAGDLCALQFSVLKRGGAQLRAEQLSVRGSDREIVAAAAAELNFDVR
jgi:hypothetical protein